MKKIIPITITLICAFLSIAFWGEPEMFGWVCAMSGWSQLCFKEQS